MGPSCSSDTINAPQPSRSSSFNIDRTAGPSTIMLRWYSAATCRLRYRESCRYFHSHGPSRAASQFMMPAMSPTMTEGNITSWKLEAGDAFKAGDVILEIETDKATMDVEAQDDGVIGKILIQAGTKAIKVGTSIAIMAEEGDDISKLEMAQDVKSHTQQKEQSNNTPIVNISSKDSITNERPQLRQSKRVAPSEPRTREHEDTSMRATVFSPAVQSLLRHYDLKADSIPTTGPKGRLLKGDVLAFAKKIDFKASKAIQTAYEQRSRLDLSNIKPAPPLAKSEDKARNDFVENPVIELRRNVDLGHLISMSRQMSAAQGIKINVADLAAKAAARALEDVPRFGLSEISAYDELFESLVSSTPKIPAPSLTPLSPQVKVISTQEPISTEAYEGGPIRLPTRAPESSFLTLQAASAPIYKAETTDIDIYDILLDNHSVMGGLTRVDTSIKTDNMLISLSFRQGMAKPEVASTFLDRAAQYIEAPAHLYM